jgi:transposase
MRVAVQVVLSVEEREELERLAAGRRLPARVVERAGIVLLAAEGKQDREIASVFGVSRRTVSLWRRRFVEKRIPGILKDAPRPGRSRRISPEVPAKIIQKTTQEKPVGRTHWSTRSLAKVMGLSPEHALVFSVDEKSQLQALDRTQPGLPLVPGVAQVSSPHRPRDPKDKDIHLIADNYATHKHPEVQAWLERHPRFTMHFTPTSASWLNMVERFFRDLTQNRLRRGVFRSVGDLMTAIAEYLVQHNQDPKPYIWTKSASDILEKVTRAQAMLKAISV